LWQPFPCKGSGGSGDGGAWDHSQGNCSKHYFSKSNILNINLDPPVVIEDRQLAVLAAHVATTIRRLKNAQRRGQATVVKTVAEGWCSKYSFSKSTILNINLDSPVVVKNRQVAVLAAHVVMTMRRLTNAQRRGQAKVAKAEAARKGRQQSTKKWQQRCSK
jgi:hypothetical protein